MSPVYVLTFLSLARIRFVCFLLVKIGFLDFVTISLSSSYSFCKFFSYACWELQPKHWEAGGQLHVNFTCICTPTCKDITLFIMLWLLVIARHWTYIFHKFRWINVVLHQFFFQYWWLRGELWSKIYINILGWVLMCRSWLTINEMVSKFCHLQMVASFSICSFSIICLGLFEPCCQVPLFLVGNVWSVNGGEHWHA